MAKRQGERKLLQEAMPLIDRCGLLMNAYGKTPYVIGAALAHLSAGYLAGYRVEDREKEMNALLELIPRLVPILVEEMIAAGRVPEDWRSPIKQ